MAFRLQPFEQAF